MLRAVSGLWDAAADAAPHDGPARVGLVLDALVDARAPQLFDVDDRRERRLQGLLDAVRDHYAAPALGVGEVRRSGGAVHPGRSSSRSIYEYLQDITLHVWS